MEQIFLFFGTALLAVTSVCSQSSYNVLPSTDLESFKAATVPCAVYFSTKSPEKMKRDWDLKQFLTNFAESGRYLEDFDVKFATVDCTSDPVEEFCSQKKALKTLFVFSFGRVLAELTLDSLYNVDAIISNLLHLVLLREVPFIQHPQDLAALQNRVRGRRDVLFAKLMAVGTPEHRAFMESAFAYSHLYQFVITTNMETNMLGPGSDLEWRESRDRVWLLNCRQAKGPDPCQRSFFRGKLTVPEFALYLKTLDVQPYVEYKSSGTTVFYQRLGIPTAYFYSNSDQYQTHKATVQSLAQTFRGSLGFVLVNSDKTPESVMEGSEHCHPPCLMLQRAPQESLIEMVGTLTADGISAFIEDNMYVEAELSEEEMPEEQQEVPVQELQDDEVQFAVFRDSQTVDMSSVSKLDDKTFPEYIAGPQLVVVLFTVRWDPRCKAFLESYAAAAATISQDATSDLPASAAGPLGHVECFSWTDVCQRGNVTAYPTIRLYSKGKPLADYRGPLSQDGILKAYRLHATATPLPLESCGDCRSFSRGSLPPWASALLGAVVVGVFPDAAEKEMAGYRRAAEMLRGKQLMGVCPAECADHIAIADSSKASVMVFKWTDAHQPKAEYSGDYTVDSLLQFVHTATRPLVPELNPSTFPLYYAQGKPFLILFRDQDQQSAQAETSLAQLARDKAYASDLSILWMDVSQPACLGSEILRDYGIHRQSLQPSLVFVDHRASRVCNYPADFSLAAPAMADWLSIVLGGQTSCSSLREGAFKPQVNPYDFLAFIRDGAMDPAQGQKMSRLPGDRHHADELEEMEEEAVEGAAYGVDALPEKGLHTEL